MNNISRPGTKYFRKRLTSPIRGETMFRFRVLALATCVLAVGGLFVQAQDDELKAVLRKAIEAHGGQKTLDKLGATSKFKGTIELMGQTLDLTGESAFQRPNKIKNSVTLNVN